MVDIAAVRAFADAFVTEDDTQETARTAARRRGIDPGSPSTGAALAVAAAAGPAAQIVEIGTGTGVSGLWLLRGAPEAQLTTIDADPDHHQTAPQLLAARGRRVRFITGRAAEVLPRMNDAAYDLVYIDGGWEAAAVHLDAGMRLVRPGGSVLVARVLQQDRVTQPARRDRASVTYRDLLRSVREEQALASLSIVGDGLLQVVRRRPPDPPLS